MNIELFLKAKQLEDEIKGLITVHDNWDGKLYTFDSSTIYIDNVNNLAKDIKVRIMEEIKIKQKQFEEL